MAIANQILKALGGFEDLLFGQGTVNQTRAGILTAITKLNATLMPYSGDTATGDFVSVASKILNLDINSAPRGHLDLTVVDGINNLTVAQFENATYDISGTLTANATLIIPDNLPNVFIIDNITTGAFTLTIKHNATAGVIVPQGERSLVYTTGLLVEDVAQSATIIAAGVENTPYAGIAETNVQGALDGLEDRKLDISAAVANFVGAVVASAASSIPTGYLECDAAAISRTTYSDLFTAIGTTYGIGDGSTTFNLPDLRGEFIRGWDNGRGIDAARGFGSAQADAFKTHTHNLAIGISSVQTFAESGATTTNTGPTTSSATGGTETRPRNIAMMYVIKT